MSSMSNMSSMCPICQQINTQYDERYPGSVCNLCILDAVDKKGNPVRFYNGITGFGFESHHTVRSKKSTSTLIKSDHLCFIHNVKCWADEARFGGIVVTIS